MKLNLGCGDDIRQGYVNCDLFKLQGVDLIIDLDKPLPFPDKSVDEVLFYNAIEHVKEPIFTIEEIWRVCKTGAKIFISAPHTANHVLNGKLVHRRNGINAFTFKSFNEKERYHYMSKAHFKILEVHYTMFCFKWLTKFFEKHFILTEYLISRWIGIDNCQQVLEVLP